MQRNGKRWVSVSMVAAVAAAMVLGGLAACGQKGPLTLPGSTASPGATPAAIPASGASASSSR